MAKLATDKQPTLRVALIRAANTHIDVAETALALARGLNMGSPGISVAIAIRCWVKKSHEVVCPSNAPPWLDKIPMTGTEM